VSKPILGGGYIKARYDGNPLDFNHDCPHCGYAYVYPPVEFADGDTACIWCADHEMPRPRCWRFTADRWQLYRIYNVDRYPTLNLEISKR